MSSFLERQLDGGVVIEQPIIEETPIEQAPVIATPVEEAPVETVETPVEEPVDLAPVKEEIDYKDWFSNNKDTLYEYLKETNTDYKQLSAQELVEKKLRADNPQFDEQDIQQELQERYGVGLTKIEINPDVMDDLEIAEAKLHNKEVDKLVSKGNRSLKKDSAEALDFFESKKGSIELPKFEIERQAAVKEQTLSIEDYFAEQQVVAQEFKEKEWIPQLKQVIDPFTSITKNVEYEDNGNKVVLSVDYKLSEGEKGEILAGLSDYIQQPTDQKYFDADGNPDVHRFVQDKSAEMHLEKLLRTVAKEAAAKARQDFVKNDLVNFDDGGKQRPDASGNEPFEKGFFKAAASNSKNRL